MGETVNLVTKQDKLDILPKKERMKVEQSWDDYHSDYPDYNKVYRWLGSNIGANWDSVCSCFIQLKWIQPRYRNTHFLYTFVEVNTFLDSGRICYYVDSCYNLNGSPIRFVYESDDLYYINPETKILCYRPKIGKRQYKKLWEEKQSKDLIILGEYYQLVKFNGIWYEAWLEFIREDRKKYIKPYESLAGYIEYKSYNITNMSGVYCGKLYKKQLSKKSLKKFGVNND